MLPRAKKVSSAARVSDGMLQSNSEGSLHYCLLLSGGDTNNRGEDDEGFNTPVCSLCICWQRSIISQYRTCAKTDFLKQLAMGNAECENAEWEKTFHVPQSEFPIDTGCSSNGKTLVLHAGDRGSIPRRSTELKRKTNWKVAGYGLPGWSAKPFFAFAI